MPPPPKFDRPSSRLAALSDRLRTWRRTAGIAAFTTAIGASTHLAFPVLRRIWQRRIDRGEPVVLDEIAGPRPHQRFEHPDPPAADLSPRPGKSRKARHMKLPAYPPPEYDFVYREPPISGNTINGLGETTPRRAVPVFFGDNFQRAWGRLDWHFQVMEPTAVHRAILGIFWQDRARVGPVTPQRVAFDDPAQAAAQVKQVAAEAGAALVGITHLTDDLRYAGFDTPFAHAISVAVPMDREDMLHAPSDRSGLEIQRAYRDVNRVAIAVASHIRRLGWPARASTNISPDAVEVLHLPTAIAAGLGQLGKHGSIITPELGSNLRLATVLTDLPLAVDTPRDFGVDDFCSRCRICEENCPPHAISPAKQWVRGVRSGTSTSTRACPTSPRPTAVASASRCARGASPAGVRPYSTSSSPSGLPSSKGRPARPWPEPRSTASSGPLTQKPPKRTSAEGSGSLPRAKSTAWPLSR